MYPAYRPSTKVHSLNSELNPWVKSGLCYCECVVMPWKPQKVESSFDKITLGNRYYCPWEPRGKNYFRLLHLTQDLPITCFKRRQRRHRGDGCGAEENNATRSHNKIVERKTALRSAHSAVSESVPLPFFQPSFMCVYTSHYCSFDRAS